MADGNGGGGNTLLALIVGGLLVVVAMFFVFGGFPGREVEGPSIKVSCPIPASKIRSGYQCPLTYQPTSANV